MPPREFLLARPAWPGWSEALNCRVWGVWCLIHRADPVWRCRRRSHGVGAAPTAPPSSYPSSSRARQPPPRPSPKCPCASTPSAPDSLPTCPAFSVSSRPGDAGLEIRPAPGAFPSRVPTTSPRKIKSRIGLRSRQAAWGGGGGGVTAMGLRVRRDQTPSISMSRGEEMRVSRCLAFLALTRSRAPPPSPTSPQTTPSAGPRGSPDAFCLTFGDL